MCTAYLQIFRYCCFCKNKKILKPNFHVFGIFLSSWSRKKCESVKNPPWLYQESVLPLWGVGHGSVSNPSWLWEESITCGDWLQFYWPYPTVTEFSPSHDGLLAQPWRTPDRAKTDFSQTRRLFFFFFFKTHKNMKIKSK